MSRWDPDVYVQITSAGRSFSFRQTGPADRRRWVVESIKFLANELLAADAQLPDANPAVSAHLDGLARALFEEES